MTLRWLATDREILESRRQFHRVVLGSSGEGWCLEWTIFENYSLLEKDVDYALTTLMRKVIAFGHG
jgi:hypothetical protein